MRQHVEIFPQGHHTKAVAQNRSKLYFALADELDNFPSGTGFEGMKVSWGEVEA